MSFRDDQLVTKAIARGNRQEYYQKTHVDLLPSSSVDNNYSSNSNDFGAISEGGTIVISSIKNIMNSTISVPALSSTTTTRHLAFSLVQFHRERIHGMSGTIATRRLIRCHFRLCGSISSSLQAKELAYNIMKNAFVTVFSGDLQHEEEVSLFLRLVFSLTLEY